MQIAPDLGNVAQRSYPVFRQMLGRSKARAHQDHRAFDCTRRKDNARSGRDLAPVAKDDTRRAVFGDRHLIDFAPGIHLYTPGLLRRTQERIRSRPPASVVQVRVTDPRAFPFRSRGGVLVIGPEGLPKALSQRVRIGKTRWTQGGFDRCERGGNIGAPPTGDRPIVKVIRATAKPDHRID